VRTLVTGGAGFIGSHVVDALVGRGDDVVILDDLSSARREHLNPSAEFVEGRLEDLNDVRRAVDGCEIIFHLGAHRSIFRSVEHPIDSSAANTQGTLAVLVAAKETGARRVVNSSSSSVYGGAPQRPTPEDAPTIPRSPYAVSKLAAEHHCRVFSELFGLETVSLRYFNVYGPRQDPGSKYAAVIPLFIQAILTGEAPQVHGDGRQSRDFTFVADAVAANLRAAAASPDAARGQAYNVAGGEPWTLLQLLAQLGQLTATEPRPTFTEPRAGDVRHTWADTSAARKALGYRPAVSMHEGLTATVDWFQTPVSPIC
jgi:UDP-glucose 4-epimerase